MLRSSRGYRTGRRFVSRKEKVQRGKVSSGKLVQAGTSVSPLSQGPRKGRIGRTDITCPANEDRAISTGVTVESSTSSRWQFVSSLTREYSRSMRPPWTAVTFLDERSNQPRCTAVYCSRHRGKRHSLRVPASLFLHDAGNAMVPQPKRPVRVNLSTTCHFHALSPAQGSCCCCAPVPGWTPCGCPYP